MKTAGERKGERAAVRDQRSEVRIQELEKEVVARLESQCSSSHGGKYPSAAEMDEQKRGSWRFAMEGGRGLEGGGITGCRARLEAGELLQKGRHELS